MSGVRIGVLLCLDADLEAQCIRRLENSADLEVQRRCADLTELLSAAEAGIGLLAAVDAQTSGINRDDVARIQSCGVRVVVTNSEGDLGADATSSAQMGDIIEELLGQARKVTVHTQVTSSPTTNRADGKIVAVCSPPGSTGKSTLVLNLAAALAETVSPVLAVDADMSAPCLDQLSNIQTEFSGLAVAINRAGRGTLSADQLREIVAPGPGGIGVLTGLSHSGRWREIGPESLSFLFEKCREIAAWTVVDIAAALDLPGRELSFGAHRDDVTMRTLQSADFIVLVGEAGPVGLTRVIRELENDFYSGAQVIINRVSKDSCGRFAHRAIREIISQAHPEIEPILIEADYPACHGALFQGQTWAEYGAENLRRSLNPLLERLGIPATTRFRKRK